MNIPKQFTLFATTWNIKQVAKINKDKDHGQCDINTNTIQLVRNLKKDYKEATYCHELIHAMLLTLGYAELSNDEILVERLGQALHQILTTSK